jgi:hypothetical protein
MASSRRAASVTLREALGVPVDLIMVPESHVDEWDHFEGTILDAPSEGRVPLYPGGANSAEPESSSRTALVYIPSVRGPEQLLMAVCVEQACLAGPLDRFTT